VRHLQHPTQNGTPHYQTTPDQCNNADETYIKVKGKWTYYYRAIDKFGKTLVSMLSEYRDDAAATAFFTRAIGNNGVPDRVVIAKAVPISPVYKT
jgi:transposase-like protein